MCQLPFVALRVCWCFQVLMTSSVRENGSKGSACGKRNVWTYFEKIQHAHKARCTPCGRSCVHWSINKLPQSSNMQVSPVPWAKRRRAMIRLGNARQARLLCETSIVPMVKLQRLLSGLWTWWPSICTRSIWSNVSGFMTYRDACNLVIKFQVINTSQRFFIKSMTLKKNCSKSNSAKT